MPSVRPIGLDDVHAARERINGIVLRTPLEAAGAARVMRKPSDVDELLETVRRYC